MSVSSKLSVPEFIYCYIDDDVSVVSSNAFLEDCDEIKAYSTDSHNNEDLKTNHSSEVQRRISRGGKHLKESLPLQLHGGQRHLAFSSEKNQTHQRIHHNSCDHMYFREKNQMHRSHECFPIEGHSFTQSYNFHTQAHYQTDVSGRNYNCFRNNQNSLVGLCRYHRPPDMRRNHTTHSCQNQRPTYISQGRHQNYHNPRMNNDYFSCDHRIDFHRRKHFYKPYPLSTRRRSPNEKWNGRGYPPQDCRGKRSSR